MVLLLGSFVFCLWCITVKKLIILSTPPFSISYLGCMKRLVNLVRNKYFLATTAFITWMLFFDRNDFLSQYEYRSQLSKLRDEKAFYIQEATTARKALDELTTNKESMERFAREKYRMKKENEDVYVVVKKKAEQ